MIWGVKRYVVAKTLKKLERKQPDRRIHRINEAKTSMPIERKTGQSLPPQGERISLQKIEDLFFMKILLFP